MSQQEFNKIHFQKLEDFEKKNKEFLSNRIIKSFLNKQENYQLFLDTIQNPTIDNKEKLDRKFKLFYFNIRFISYISSSLYFNAVNFDKKQRTYSSKYSLSIDRTVQNDEEITFKDIIEDPNSEITIDKLSMGDDISDYIMNPVLYEAIQSLSLKQKEVINLAYMKGLSDTEIAKALDKSQQSVSKIHKKALSKIHDFFREKGG